MIPLSNNRYFFYLKPNIEKEIEMLTLTENSKIVFHM
ncbi:Hypothetical protein Eab7_2728 [Exiguobacterium antarcticum B7]|nr:Hypothetical protein Eab7_2728 [Exiguobacterium antarcticum B7]